MIIIIQPRRYLYKQYILKYNSFWSLWPRIRHKDFLYDLSYLQWWLGTNSYKLKYDYNNSAKKIFIQTMSSFFLLCFSQPKKTYGVGRSSVASPKDVKKNELQYILKYYSFWSLWPRIRPKDFLYMTWATFSDGWVQIVIN